MPFTIAPPGDAHDFCKVNLRLHAAKIGAANDKRKKLLSLTIVPLGMMVELSDRYILTSNRESGLGRYDVMLEPKNRSDNAIILELKIRFNEKIV